MGTIKDVVDLLKELSSRVKDRKSAEDLARLQSLILNIQAEDAALHERNVALREENLGLKERIQGLEAKIAELSSAASSAASSAPRCPNCSTNSKPFYMRPIGAEFREIAGATHECPKCEYTENVKS